MTRPALLAAAPVPYRRASLRARKPASHRH